MKFKPINIICPACGNRNYMYYLMGKNVGRLDIKCINCNSYYNSDELYNSLAVLKQEPKPTNADRIRAMTNEELDSFLKEVQWDVANFCGGVTEKQKYPLPQKRGWLDWLKQEADNG